MKLNLKQMRKDAQMTQSEMAEKLNTTQTTISDWERGKSNPSIEFMMEISDIFGVSVDELVGRMPTGDISYFGMSSEDKEFVTKYLSLNAQNKYRVMGYADSLKERSAFETVFRKTK